MALVTYLIWVMATFLLEGRILTLLRPEAVADRVVYALVANILAGSLLALLVVRHAIKMDITSLSSSGFQPLKRTLLAIGIAGILGLLVLILLRPASLDPVVLVNVYAQVFGVTIAEVAVCWVVVGSIAKGVVSGKGKVIPIASAMLLSSILFGVYHLAHSPPFNQLTMVFFLSLIGMVTSIVYFTGRDLYAAMVFHNFSGTYGVLQSLSATGLLAAYTRPHLPVIGMAVLSLLIFAGFDLLSVRKVRPAG